MIEIMQDKAVTPPSSNISPSKETNNEQPTIIFKQLTQNYSDNTTQLKQGDIVIFYSSQDGWSECSYKGKTIQIPTSYLQNVTPPTTTQQPTNNNGQTLAELFFERPKNILRQRSSIVLSTLKRALTTKQLTKGSEDKKTTTTGMRRTQSNIELSEAQKGKRVSTSQQDNKMMETISPSKLKLSEPLSADFYKNQNGEFMFGNRTLEELKAICLSDQKYGYMTMEQMVNFGLLFGFSSMIISILQFLNG